MTPLRRLLTITSRIGRPGTLLSVGHSEGNLLYLEVAMTPVSVVAALEPADVAQLHAALAEWLRERSEVTSPVPFGPPAAGSPLVGGLLGRVVADARAARPVMQFCTVPDPVQAADQHEHDAGRELPAV